jgi:cytochrome c oxidase subunit 2
MRAWWVRLMVAAVGMVATATLAVASEPTPWGIQFQTPATPVMEDIVAFNLLVTWIIVLVTAFVLGLLAYVCYRFRASANPTPSRRTHNALLEVVWTAVPVLILVVIAIPSFKLLYKADVIPAADMTIKAIGRQWYWSYEYPDHGDFTFDAYMIADEDLKESQLRLLSTDNTVVVPVDTIVRVLVTASDVLHSWAIPAFGVKIDGVPGRINQTWFKATAEGTYYGQCSELCGAYHGFMPIQVEVVSAAAFEAWTKEAQEQFARADVIDVAARRLTD